MLSLWHRLNANVNKDLLLWFGLWDSFGMCHILVLFPGWAGGAWQPWGDTGLTQHASQLAYSWLLLSSVMENKIGILWLLDVTRGGGRP